MTFRRTLATLTTVAFIALSIVVAQPAAADACSFDPDTKTVTLPPGPAVVSSDPSFGTPTICGATFDQINTVVWSGTSGDDEFLFDVVDGTFTPGASPDPDGSPEIKFQLDAGDGYDTIEIEGLSELTYDIVSVSSGIDLNGDGDVDATVANAEHLETRLGAGPDILDASAGLPTGMDGMTVEAGPNDDTILGSAGDDTIYYDGSNDTIDAGAGDDTVSIRNRFAPYTLETPSFAGGPGEDTLLWDELGAAATADLAGGSVTWSYPGGADGSLSGFEDLVGGDASDVLIGDGASNVLDSAGGFGDVIRGNGGNDTLKTTGPSTWADFGDASGVDVDLVAGTATGDGNDTLIGIRNVIGSPGDDSIQGIDDQASEMLGGAGNDTISGGPFEDLLMGGSGKDDLRGSGSLDDLHGGPGDDLLVGGAGGDDFSGGSGHDDIRGGIGVDSWNASFSSIAEQGEPPTEGASVNLSKATVADDGFGDVDTISGIEDASGTFFADRLIGDAGDNILNGSSGNDRLVGGPGNDDLFGGTGRDTLSFATATHALDVDLTQGTATGDGHDTLDGIEVVIGGPGGDTLRGSSADQRLEGHGGDDELLGRAGRDALVGGPGADAMDGGEGRDTCNGGDSHEDTAKRCETIWRVP